MGKYNFEDDDSFGKTVRLDDISKKLGAPGENDFENTKITPSQTQKQRYEYKGISNSVNSSGPNTGSIQKVSYQNKNKSPFPASYAVVVFIICIVTAAGAAIVAYTSSKHSVSPTPNIVTPQTPLSSGNNSQNNIGATENNNNSISDDSAKTSAEQNHSVAVIKSISSGTRSIEFYDIDKNETFNFKTAPNIVLTGIKGEVADISKLIVGDIVLITTDTDDVIQSVEMSGEVWQRVNVSGVKVSDDGKTIEFNGENYGLCQSLTVTRNGKIIDDYTIEDIDIIDVKGFGDDVYSIDIQQYHGYITIANSKKISDGTISIDNGEKLSISENEKTVVRDGVHKILIQGSDIENYSAEIFVTSGEEFVIDAADIQQKSAVLEINANVDNYIVYVDNKRIEQFDSHIMLPLGEYQLTIKKEGFEDWLGSVKIDSDTNTVNVTMKSVGHKLDITTDPSGASIYIDNVYIGKSPITTYVEDGEHRIFGKMDSYGSFVETIYADGEGDLNPVDVTMKKID